MLKTILDWALTLNLIVLSALVVYLWWSGNLTVAVGPEAHNKSTHTNTVDATTEQLFTTTLREEVDRQLGQPIEGYTPDMFIAVFPGLVVTDFEDVEASIGKYVVVEGTLVHVMPPGRPVHSAAAAVSSRGLVTLLKNVAARAHIDLSHSGTITDVMRVISEEQL